VIDIENQRDEDLDKEAAEHVNNLSSPLLRSRYHFGMHNIFFIDSRYWGLPYFIHYGSVFPLNLLNL